MLDEHIIEEKLRNTNFGYSIRKAWSLLKKLGSSQPPVKQQPKVTPNQLVKHMVEISRVSADKEHNRKIECELKALTTTA